MRKAMTQVKFTIESEIVSAFKSRCASEGVSMASVIREWMKTRPPVKTANIRTETRPQRRKVAVEYIDKLNELLDKETEYRDNIPEQFMQRFEDADHTCDMLTEAITCLEDAY